jgi:hypothetical protein
MIVAVFCGSQILFCSPCSSPRIIVSNRASLRPREEIGDEACTLGPVTEVRPRRGKKYSLAVIVPQRRKLSFNLVRRRKVIRVQLLDVVTLAKAEGVVYRPRKALVR